MKSRVARWMTYLKGLGAPLTSPKSRLRRPLLAGVATVLAVTLPIVAASRWIRSNDGTADLVGGPTSTAPTSEKLSNIPPSRSSAPPAATSTLTTQPPSTPSASNGSTPSPTVNRSPGGRAPISPSPPERTGSLESPGPGSPGPPTPPTGPVQPKPSTATTSTAPPPPPMTFDEIGGTRLGSKTFRDTQGLDLGPNTIQFGQTVQVSCKVFDPRMDSANPDGYWYRIASTPWDNEFYAVANTFTNGAPLGSIGPPHTDMRVPDC